MMHLLWLLLVQLSLSHALIGVGFCTLFREEKEYDTSNLTNELLCATPQIYQIISMAISIKASFEKKQLEMEFH
jgi:hypothetical protein